MIKKLNQIMIVAGLLLAWAVTPFAAYANGVDLVESVPSEIGEQLESTSGEHVHAAEVDDCGIPEQHPHHEPHCTSVSFSLLPATALVADRVQRDRYLPVAHLVHHGRNLMPEPRPPRG